MWSTWAIRITTTPHIWQTPWSRAMTASLVRRHSGVQ
jgi:hypothetical protein